jgi:hypothetical protein
MRVRAARAISAKGEGRGKEAGQNTLQELQELQELQDQFAAVPKNKKTRPGINDKDNTYNNATSSLSVRKDLVLQLLHLLREPSNGGFVCRSDAGAAAGLLLRSCSRVMAF